jgi:lysophospholipase L1-like esterase
MIRRAGPRRSRILAATLAGALALAAASVAAVLLRPPGAAPPLRPADRPPAPWPAPETAAAAAGETGKPARIVAFGTSLTASNAWPDGLAAALGACLGHPVAVIRVARNGAGSDWALTQLDRVVAARPDAVLIEFAVNDADILDGIPVAASRARHAAILDALAARLPEARLVLMTMNPVTGPVRRLQRPFLADYEAMLRGLAAGTGAALADLAPRWRAAFAADPALAPPDGLHPGDAATAAVTVPALAGMLAAAAGRTC